MSLDLSIRSSALPAASDDSVYADPRPAVPATTLSGKLERFLSEDRATPYVVIDLDMVEAHYRALRDALPAADVFYAVKANPSPLVLERLVDLGSRFDAASISEIVQVMAAGAEPERISYGNTVKKAADIAKAHAFGVDLFALDSMAELEKIARHAPGARVFVRIVSSGEGSDWPLSHKFGCRPDQATELLIRARDLGLVPYGVSFHVGSQQRDPAQWRHMIAKTAGVFQDVAAAGIRLGLVNLGGGFPAGLRGGPVPDIRAYGRAIMAAMTEHFGADLPAMIVEPGRGLVANAGVLMTEVVLVAERGAEDKAWVYLDVGMFGGLAETMEEAILYPIESARGGPCRPVVLAGPTCDSADVLYEKADYRLPVGLASGDRLRIRCTGAYTTTYSTVGFNGFAPLTTYCI